MSISFESAPLNAGFGEMPKPHIDTLQPTDTPPLAREFEGPAQELSYHDREPYRSAYQAQDYGMYAVGTEVLLDRN